MSERYDLGGAYFDILQHETCKRLLNVYTKRLYEYGTQIILSHNNSIVVSNSRQLHPCDVSYWQPLVNQ